MRPTLHLLQSPAFGCSLLPAACTALLAAVLLAGCDIDVSLEDFRSVAVAGDDQQAVLEGDAASVALDGKWSFVAGKEGTAPERYSWTIVSSPAKSGRITATLETPNAPSTNVVLRAPGLYVVRLDVYYQGIIGTPDYVSIVVTTAPARRLPIADAGPDLEVQVGDVVTLDGSSSYAPGGGGLLYEWTQVFGLFSGLEGTGDRLASFTAPSMQGQLRFRLVVIDDDGVSSFPAVVNVSVVEEL